MRARSRSSPRSGPASSTPGDDPRADGGGRRRLPDQHEPRQPGRQGASWSRRSARSRRALHRPTTILFDLQGPKLRVGSFKGGSAMLEAGQMFVFDRDPAPGDANRVELPHPELFAAVDEGRAAADRRRQGAAARSTAVEADRIAAVVEVGGKVSNSKGVNVPDVLIPIPALTEKDRSRPAVRARAGRRLYRLVVRPAARGRRRSARTGRRPGGAAGQDREAAGDRPARRDPRAGRRGDGGARRPWRRTAARGRAAAAEPDRRDGAPGGQAGGGRDADARIDDRLADPDAGRSQRRRQCDLRRRRRGDAVGRKRGRAPIRSKRSR